MNFGIGFGQDSWVGDIQDQARTAENAGFSHATFIDMGLLASDVIVMLTLIGQNTKEMQIGQGVTDPITHNPAVVANAVATLRELTHDRAFLGVGVGGPYGKPFTRPARISELREAVRFVKDYTAGNEAQIQGNSWHSEWIRRSTYAGRSVPAYIAVCGPRTTQLAGELGDACLSAGTDVGLQRWRMEMLEKGAAAAGRDPTKIDLWVRTQCFISDSKEAARREVAPYAATCALEFHKMLQMRTPDTVDLAETIERQHPGLLDDMKSVYEVWDPYYTERVGGPQIDAVTPEIVDFFLAAGTADDVGEQIERLDELGIKGIWSVLYAIHDQMGTVQEISKNLISRFA